MSVNANLIGHTGYTGASTIEKARFLQTDQNIGSSKIPVYIQYQGSESKGLPIACEKINYSLSNVNFTFSSTMDNTYVGYPYVGIYSNEIITETMAPIGNFDFSVQESQIYAPIIETQNGFCRIWARSLPNNNQVTMPNLVLIDKQN